MKTRLIETSLNSFASTDLQCIQKSRSPLAAVASEPCEYPVCVFDHSDGDSSSSEDDEPDGSRAAAAKGGPPNPGSLFQSLDTLFNTSKLDRGMLS